MIAENLRLMGMSKDCRGQVGKPGTSHFPSISPSLSEFEDL